MTTRAEPYELDDVDRELLNAVQWDFPLEPRPYAALGERLGISEPEVRDRIDKVKQAGVLRQLSAIFDTRALGYTSALVAAKVDPDHVDEAAADRQRAPRRQPQLQAQPRVQPLVHDRGAARRLARRAHRRAAPRRRARSVTRKLPTLKLYKIGVKLDMTGKTAANAKTEVLEHERPERKAEMPVPDLSELELAVIRDRAGRPSQRRAAVRGAGRGDRHRRGDAPRHDPLVQGAQAHASLRGGDEPPQRGLQGQRDGRVGGPRRPARRDRAADGRASRPSATATAARPTTTGPTACSRWCTAAAPATAKATIEAIRDETGVDEYCLLWSVKEYKKIRLRYFGTEWQDWERRHLGARGTEVPARP